MPIQARKAASAMCLRVSGDIGSRGGPSSTSRKRRFSVAGMGVGEGMGRQDERLPPPVSISGSDQVLDAVAILEELLVSRVHPRTAEGVDVESLDDFVLAVLARHREAVD